MERPYLYGANYYKAAKAICPQRDLPDKVEEILSFLTAVLDNTADLARNYASVQKTLRDHASYRDGTYSLFTPLLEETGAKAPTEPVPEQSREETAEKMKPDDGDFAVVIGLMEGVGSFPAIKPPYDLQAGTVVYIGMDKYESQSMSDETVILHDLTYPFFTKDFSREAYDRKLRENPANDYLKIKRPLPELPAKNKKKNRNPHRTYRSLPPTGFLSEQSL